MGSHKGLLTIVDDILNLGAVADNAEKEPEPIYRSNVFGISKEGDEAWNRVEIVDVISKYDGLSWHRP